MENKERELKDLTKRTGHLKKRSITIQNRKEFNVSHSTMASFSLPNENYMNPFQFEFD